MEFMILTETKTDVYKRLPGGLVIDGASDSYNGVAVVYRLGLFVEVAIKVT